MRLPAMSSGSGRITFSRSSGVIYAERGCRDFSNTIAGGVCTVNGRECCDIVEKCYHTRSGGEICFHEKENCQTRGTGFSCTYDPGHF